MISGQIPGGLLIAVEGIDGAGKTTLAHALGERFRAVGMPVSVSKEPTKGPWGQVLRESAASGRLTVGEELRLLLLDRKQHCEELIEPALARDEVVVLDRYYPSNAAYQGAAGMDVDDLLQQNAFAPAPDLVLVLDLEPSEGIRRIYARGDKPNHFETEDALIACRRIFLEMNLRNRVVVDASVSVEAVLEKAWAAITGAATNKLQARLGFSVEAAEALIAFSKVLPA